MELDSRVEQIIRSEATGDVAERILHLIRELSEDSGLTVARAVRVTAETSSDHGMHPRLEPTGLHDLDR